MIRKAWVLDVKNIHKLLSTFSDRGEILPRSLSEIYDNLRDYCIFCDEKQKTIIGTCAVHITWEDLAEIRSLAVKEEFTKRGIGRKLVESCIAEARELGIHRVFVLTYEREFFEKVGFHLVDKSSLPHKIWADCLKCVKFPDCDETAMMREI
ncbi:MAG: N-acetyltransferase [Deltaproteobacteria bacterium]|jgi:amino-acid N-acetyltransferase|nr:N-acetyltransferase [Deltaproteobacteria bacterium]MCK5187061.1 N-acetyltransferase [Deltaproteobacteria bacterium]MCK5257280.1 N-acetyltransferase [Deltaproteobacteria bacterium]MCK5422418.1 N-acetyltransferase [Deltaproteobacteria bacterium]